MVALLRDLFTICIAVTVGATTLALGMAFGVPQLLRPLKQLRVVGMMIAFNALAVPALVLGVVAAFPLTSAHATGLFLAAVGTAGPVGLKAAQLTGTADMPLALALVVVLQLVDLVSVPAWARAAHLGVAADSSSIVRTLLLLILLPLAIGLIARGRFGERAAVYRPWITKLSSVALVVAVVVGITAYWRVIVEALRSWVLVAALVVIVLCTGLGWLLGGREPRLRRTTGIISGARFATLGLILVAINFNGRADYMSAAICFALLDLLLLVLFAAVLGHRARSGSRGDTRKGRRPLGDVSQTSAAGADD